MSLTVPVIETVNSDTARFKVGAIMYGHSIQDYFANLTYDSLFGWVELTKKVCYFIRTSDHCTPLSRTSQVLATTVKV